MTDNLRKTIAKSFQEKVVEQLKPQVKARDEAEAKAARLEKAIAEYEQKTGDLRQEIKILTSEIAADLAKGKDVAKSQAQLHRQCGELAGFEELAREIRESSLSTASEVVMKAQKALEQTTKELMRKVRTECETQMSRKIDEFMAIFDAWNESSKSLYKDLRVNLIPGTPDEVPQVRNDRFERYVRAVAIGMGV
jgi:cytochrome c551/c552